MCCRVVFALFYFVFEGIFQVQALGGLNSGGDFMDGFCVTSLGGLYLGGLYLGGLFSEF